MIFEQIPIGGDRNFAYLVGDEQAGEVMAVDVGSMPQMIVERLDKLGVELLYIVTTHGHHDHTGGVKHLKKATEAPFAAHPDVSGVDVPLDDGAALVIGEVMVDVLHCPGHSPDSIALLVNGEKLLTGDELFVGKVGGTRSEDQALQQYESLHDVLMDLGDDIEVWPGHNVGVRPHSTIGDERRTNPFILQPNFEDFYHLKQHWQEYKRQHGIA